MIEVELDAEVSILNLPQAGKILNEVLVLTREAIVDIANASLCVATYVSADSSIAINSTQRLAREQIETIVERITADPIRKISHGQVTRVPAVEINDEPLESYLFDNQACAFQQESLIPLTSDGSQFGALFIASFSSSFDLADEGFLKHLNGDFANVLGRLWTSIRSKQETLTTLVSSIIDGVILCDTDANIEFVNQAALRMLGLESDSDWIGKPLSDFDVSHLTDFLQEALKNNLFEVNKVINAPKSCSRLLGVHTQLLKSARNGEIGWMIVLRDVTMTWQNDQMRSALSIASHEINTPLTSIGSAVDLLLEKDLGDLNGGQTQCLNVVKDDVTRLQRLLHDILDLSRFEEGVIFIDRRKEISLEFLVNKVSRSFASFAQRKNICIINSIPKNIPTFRGDRDRLQQVLSNLIENSIKYSPPDSAVEVSATLEKSILKVAIADRGVGIPEEHCEAIFEKFLQLDNCPDHGERGFGLGLTIAREIVQAAGGRIWVDSVVGEGSTFHFTIPV